MGSSCCGGFPLPAFAGSSFAGMSEHALAYSDEPLVHRFLKIYEPGLAVTGPGG